METAGVDFSMRHQNPGSAKGRTRACLHVPEFFPNHHRYLRNCRSGSLWAAHRWRTPLGDGRCCCLRQRAVQGSNVSRRWLVDCRDFAAEALEWKLRHLCKRVRPIKKECACGEHLPIASKTWSTQDQLEQPPLLHRRHVQLVSSSPYCDSGY